MITGGRATDDVGDRWKHYLLRGLTVLSWSWIYFPACVGLYSMTEFLDAPSKCVSSVLAYAPIYGSSHRLPFMWILAYNLQGILTSFTGLFYWYKCTNCKTPNSLSWRTPLPRTMPRACKLKEKKRQRVSAVRRSNGCVYSPRGVDENIQNSTQEVKTTICMQLVRSVIRMDDE